MNTKTQDTFIFLILVLTGIATGFHIFKTVDNSKLGIVVGAVVGYAFFVNFTKKWVPFT